MRSCRSLLALTALLAALLATLVAPAAPHLEAASAAPSSVVGATISRLAGADRYQSAVEISRHRYADPTAASVVYLTRGDDFADALAAGTLTEGPVLLLRPGCSGTTVPPAVAAEVARLDPRRVIALGGTSAVCDAALHAAADGRATARIGGATRAETAALIAATAFPDGAARVYLTTGAVGPDAVVGGMLHDGPILLASNDGRTTPTATRAAVAAQGAGTVVALGGPAAVSQTALLRAADGRATSRLSGADRYATAAAIARHAYPSGTGRAYVARGDGSSFVDAVASGMLVDGPVVLASGPCNRVPGASAALLTQRHPGQVVGLGGTDALCTSTLRGASLAARPAVDCAVTRCVAITYDDGPGPSTPQLLDTLASRRIPVTFFVVGQMVDTFPQHARRAWVEGHEIGNHTWDHTQLTLLTLAQQRTEVVRTDNEITQHGIRTTSILRPPYGSYDANTRTLGFPLVLWDVDPRDWDGPPTPATTRARVVGAARDGSIVLMHDIHQNTVRAAPGIIDDLMAAGYTFVTVPELVPGLRDGDVVYRRGNVVHPATTASPADSIVLDDGTVLGPVVDEAGVPGLAPSRSTEEVLDLP